MCFGGIRDSNNFVRNLEKVSKYQFRKRQNHTKPIICLVKIKKKYKKYYFFYKTLLTCKPTLGKIRPNYYFIVHFKFYNKCLSQSGE